MKHARAYLYRFFVFVNRGFSLGPVDVQKVTKVDSPRNSKKKVAWPAVNRDPFGNGCGFRLFINFVRRRCELLFLDSLSIYLSIYRINQCPANTKRNNVTCGVPGCDRSAQFLLVCPSDTIYGCWAASHFVTLSRTRREREQGRNEVLNNANAEVGTYRGGQIQASCRLVVRRPCFLPVLHCRRR